MTNEELIARLRESVAYEWQDPIWETRLVAADRIEALIEQLAAARQDAKFAEDELEMQEQEACMMENDYIKLERERDALEAKLAKAVEALQWCAMYGDGDVALATIAEIKGDSHEALPDLR
jgi:hypothetical protein